MNKETLKGLYETNTKHSNYQILPQALKGILEEKELKIKSRFERERMKYFSSKVDFKDKKVLDIGANTGYFSFEVIDAGAKEVVVFEGDKKHAQFINIATKTVDYPIFVNSEYYNFEVNKNTFFDIVLLLNIVHHFGDDYGDQKIEKTKAKEKMIDCINSLSFNCKTMVFQMGFNWKGNRYDCLFKEGTKKEMIEFVRTGVKDFWDIEAIGVAQRKDNNTFYEDLNEINIQRDDSLGEFLNRPIIILKSLKYNGL